MNWCETSLRFGALLFLLKRAGESQMDMSHTAALETKHAQLDLKIRQEALRPRPDQGVINQLKKRKLQIKEELARG